MQSDPNLRALTTWRRQLACLAAVAAVVAGCRPADEIRTYRIAKPAAEPAAKTAPAAAASPPAERGEPTHRMLAAIVPGPDRAWFLKAVGPIDDIDAAAEAIKAFFESLSLEEGKPVWQAPEGWSERPASQMRLATLVVPTAGEGEIELSVIGLPRVGDWDSQVLDNVNRWLNQLGQPSLDAAGLSSATESLADVADGAVVLDRTGWFDGGSMAPFAGGGRPAAPPSAPAAPAAASSELAYDTPEGWSPKPGSAMRKASFSTPGGSEVTAFAFPNVPAMADPLGNVNRWRGQIELGPLTAEELEAETESIDLLGAGGQYFEFVGPTQTTYVSMAVLGPRVWFFKLNGPNESAADDRDAFRAWLDSLRIP